MAKQLTIFLSVLLILTVLLLGAKRIADAGDLTSYQASSFGQGDFLEYWSAYRVALNGDNPYDPLALLDIQKSVGWSRPEPLMMWNPPWTFLILGPTLRTNFFLSSRFWIFIGAALVVISGLLLYQTFKSEGLLLFPAIAASLFFFPLWYSMQIGQLGAILALGAAILLYSYKKNNYPLVGFSLLLLSLKAHVSYLVFVAILHRAIRERNPKPIFYAVLFTGFSALLIELRFPGILHWWWNSLTANAASSEFVAVERWKVATLTGLVRMQLANSGFGFTRPIMLLIPCLSALILLVFLIRQKQPVDWKYLFPPLFCLSYLTSPFGWAFDQSLLVITQVSAVSMLFTSPRKSGLYQFAVCAALVALSCSGEYYKTHYAVWHHQLFWFPIPLLFLWLVAYFGTRTNDERI